MKAIRKSDGKVIEVTERSSWNGEKIYTVDGTFYRKVELDFNIEEVEKVTIDRKEYEQLCKYRRYFSNWALNKVECMHCGELNPDGYMCANCGKDPKH